MYKIKLLTATVLTFCLIVTLSPAQAALEEIIVTAQKREESLQEVPMGISALSSDAIERANITNLEDLSLVISGINLQNYGGYIIPVVRGMGTLVPGGGVYMGTTTTIDDVYIPRSFITNAVIDTASVQVLKGPQGALHGRNTIGGAIVIETRRPEVGSDPSGTLRAGYGEHDAIEFNAYVQMGLTEQTAFSLEVYHNEHDPLHDFASNSQVPAEGGMNSQEDSGFTGKLVFEQDNVSMMVKGSYFDQTTSINNYYGLSDQEIPSTEQILQLNPLLAPGGPIDSFVSPGLNAAAFSAAGLSSGEVLMATILGASVGLPAPAAIGIASGIDFSPPRLFDSHSNLINSCDIPGAEAGGGIVGNHSNNSDCQSGGFHNVTHASISGHLDIDFERFTLTSITSYSEIGYLGAADIANIDPSSPGAATLIGLGFANLGLGFTGEYENENTQQELRLVSNETWDWDWILGFNYFNESQLHAVDGNSFGGFSIATRNEWEMTSYAFYAQVTYPITSNLSVTAGGRLLEDDMELQDNISDFVAAPAFDAGLLKRKDSEVTYTARLEYKTDSWMIYGGTSTGYKSAYQNADGPAFGVSEPEEVTSYEIGFKSEWQDGNLQVNGAVWYYDYENPHVSFVDNAVGGQVVFNVPEGELYGAELDLIGNVNENLGWFANMTILDTEYKSDSTLFNAGIGSTILAATGGKEFAGAPPFAMTAGLDYRVPIVSTGDLSIAPSVRYVSGIWFDSENRVGSGGADDDGYVIVNLNMQYRPNNSNWKLGIYAKNLADEEYFKSALTANGFFLAGVPGDPRQVGGYVTYDF
ncbi:MAG: TonB-dependent receptor [Halieaceae bacterium]|nr:TonB-dependent receptor [Halieaceae bacterium]